MKVNIISRKLVFDKFFKIEEAKIQFEKFNGEMSGTISRLNFERGDSVAALVYNLDSKNSIFVNQFKFPCFDKYGGWITEIPAGIIDENESPEQAIKREVIEEIGFRPRSIQKIASFFVSPGGSSERIFLYFITVKESDRVGKGGGLAIEDEDIKQIELNIDEIKSLLENDLINDAKTLIAINYLLNNHDNG